MHPRFATSRFAFARPTANPASLAFSASRSNATAASISPAKLRTTRMDENVVAADAESAPVASASAANVGPLERLNRAVTAANETTANASAGASGLATKNKATTVPTHSHKARNPRSLPAFCATNERTSPTSTVSVAASAPASFWSWKATFCARRDSNRASRNVRTASSPKDETHREYANVQTLSSAYSAIKPATRAGKPDAALAPMRHSMHRELNTGERSTAAVETAMETNAARRRRGRRRATAQATGRRRRRRSRAEEAVEGGGSAAARPSLIATAAAAGGEGSRASFMRETSSAASSSRD